MPERLKKFAEKDLRECRLEFLGTVELRVAFIIMGYLAKDKVSNFDMHNPEIEKLFNQNKDEEALRLIFKEYQMDEEKDDRIFKATLNFIKDLRK